MKGEPIRGNIYNIQHGVRRVGEVIVVSSFDEGWEVRNKRMKIIGKDNRSARFRSLYSNPPIYIEPGLAVIEDGQDYLGRYSIRDMDGADVIRRRCTNITPAFGQRGERDEFPRYYCVWFGHEANILNADERRFVLDECVNIVGTKVLNGRKLIVTNKSNVSDGRLMNSMRIFSVDGKDAMNFRFDKVDAIRRGYLTLEICGVKLLFDGEKLRKKIIPDQLNGNSILKRKINRILPSIVRLVGKFQRGIRTKGDLIRCGVPKEEAELRIIDNLKKRELCRV